MEEINSNVNRLEPEKIYSIVTGMTRSAEQLETGHKTISQFEHMRGFYAGLLKISLSPSSNDSEVKLSGSMLLNYLRRNWDNESCVSVEEKMVKGLI